jgi:hypothetical protein
MNATQIKTLTEDWNSGKLADLQRRLP